jgi:hypothetical protein
MASGAIPPQVSTEKGRRSAQTHHARRFVTSPLVTLHPSYFLHLFLPCVHPVWRRWEETGACSGGDRRDAVLTVLACPSSAFVRHLRSTSHHSHPYSHHSPPRIIHVTASVIVTSTSHLHVHIISLEHPTVAAPDLSPQTVLRCRACTERCVVLMRTHSPPFRILSLSPIRTISHILLTQRSSSSSLARRTTTTI